MIPNILEYDDKTGRVQVTPQGIAIPEVKEIVDKFENYEPYLSYICGMTRPDSPYVNIPDEEKEESIIYDVQVTLGEFDFNDPLVEQCITKFKKMYTTKMTALVEELGNEIDRIRNQLKNTPIIMGGMEDNMKIRIALLKDIGRISGEYQKVKEQVDKEMKAATKGGHEIGGY